MFKCLLTQLPDLGTKSEHSRQPHSLLMVAHVCYRYSLPKPKGGARSANAILSEDVYKARVRVPRKPAATGELDLEDIRFGELKKHANQSKNTIKGLYHLSTGARNNPNERNNMTRSNRRR